MSTSTVSGLYNMEQDMPGTAKTRRCFMLTTILSNNKSYYFITNMDLSVMLITIFYSDGEQTIELCFVNPGLSILDKITVNQLYRC